VPSTLPTNRRQRQRRRPVSTLATAAAVCLGATACGVDLISEGEEGAPVVQPAPSTPIKMTEKSVRSFYALASEAYRTRDAEQLCSMHQESYAHAMVEQAAAAGLEVTTCAEVWQIVFAAEPTGYMDQLSNVRVKGKTVTFRSGDDPWRVRVIRDEMKIVAPK